MGRMQAAIPLTSMHAFARVCVRVTAAARWRCGAVQFEHERHACASCRKPLLHASAALVVQKASGRAEAGCRGVKSARTRLVYFFGLMVVCRGGSSSLVGTTVVGVARAVACTCLRFAVAGLGGVGGDAIRVRKARGLGMNCPPRRCLRPGEKTLRTQKCDCVAVMILQPATCSGLVWDGGLVVALHTTGRVGAMILDDDTGGVAGGTV